MSYANVSHNKFMKNQNTYIYNDNDIITVKSNQETSTPGIRTNNVIFPKGKYIITIDIEINKEQIILWIQNTSTKIVQRTFLSDSINNIEVSFDNDVKVNIGIFFVVPTKSSHFVIKKFKISQNTYEPSITDFNMLSLFDHTYVINLDRRKDRMFRVDRYLKKLKINYERISGVIPTQTEFENIKKEGSKITSIGALGCIMSHINVIRNAIKNQYKSILILEDDIVPLKSFDYNKIQTPADWDILYLGSSQHNFIEQQQDKHETYYIAKKSRGTFAYIVKNHMFNKLLGLFNMFEMNVDMYLEEIQNKHKCYVIHDNFMIADLNDSDISCRRDIEKYGAKFGWNNRKYYAEVSIIVPVFNSMNYLSDCLESIKNQTFKDFELIIVNDGSTDNTDEILQQFFINNPEMIISYIKHDNNMGLPAALNSGLKNSHGLYITWISHDNKFKCDAIMKMHDYLHSNKQILLVTAGHENVCDNMIISKVIGTEYNNETIISQFHGVASFMYVRNVIEKIGLYDEELFGIEDYDYLIRILELPPYKSGYINDVLCEYRKHPNQLTHKFKNKYPELKQKMIEKRTERMKNNIIDNTTIIIETISDYIFDYKDTFIYPPIVKYDLLFQRPQQILKNMTKMCNCIFITKEDNKISCVKICDNVIVISWSKFNELKSKLLRNKIILYYTDPRAHKYINILNPNFVIFDLIDNPVGEFACWKEKLNIALSTADIITYSAKYLINVIHNSSENKISFKSEPLYLTNCCDRNFMNNPMITPVHDIVTNKKIIGYYGAISTWLDYDLIKIIANNENIHVVMIGLIKDNEKYSMKFDHPNITWLEHKDYYEIPKYLSRFDICMIPFLDSEMMKGCNPLKLYEYMSSGKPIISSIKFQDYSDDYYIITKETVNATINRLISINRVIKYQDIPFWDDICTKLYKSIVQLKQHTTNISKKCAYVTNMLVDWKTLEPRYGGGEKYALTIAKLLKENNIDVHFYQLAEITCDTKYYDFPVHCIDMKGLETYQEFNIGYSKKVNEIIKNSKYDYVIYGMPEMCCTDNICKNSISINHGIWFDRSIIIKDTKWFKCMETHVKYPCVNISVDTNFINFIRALYPEYCNKLNYIPNFYDPSIYQYIEKNNDRITIVIPRRASIYRGSRIMKDILYYVNYDVDFIWVGKGDNEENTLLKSLEQNDTRFKFTGCSFEEMNKFYNMADIVIIPTTASEGTSLSCIEAMASGCAVVSTNIGGLCNLIIDNYNGLLVNPTALEIAQAVNKLIEDKNLRIKLVRTAKQIVELYKEENWKNKWLNIFTKIGWLHQDIYNFISIDRNDIETNFVSINRNDIETNFDIYWKNYVHVNELHQKIKTIDDAFKHFKQNTNCKELQICNPKIKIAVFTRHAINGGVETIIAEEAKYMNMDIFITNGLIHQLNPFLFEVVKDIDEILKVIRKYDIVIYHWLPDFAVQAIKLSKIPAIEYLHRRDTDNNDKTVPVNIVTHSPFLINHCNIKFGKSCEMLEHPININKFIPTQSTEKYIGCFCTYNPIKGLDILLKALHNVKFRIMSDKWNQYKIIFFGKDQENYKNFLHQTAKDLGIICEFRDPVNTWEHINNYKLFIIPSRLEGLPVVLLEALTCNIPIIASNLEGTIEFYNIAKARGYNNLFQMFDSENVSDLTQKIYDWFVNPFSCELGNDYITKYYSSKIHCNKFSNIIKKYINTYQNHSEKVICYEINNFDICIVTSDNNIEKILSLNNVTINHDKFARIIIKVNKDMSKFKLLEVLLECNNIITSVPVGYQFDFIGNKSTAYSADTVTISNNSVKSICSSKLNLNNISIVQINLRPNIGNITINDIHLVAYY